MFRKPLLAFAGVAALSALAFAPLVSPGTVASADGKARAAAAGALGGSGQATAATLAAARQTPLGCVQEQAGPFNCDNVDLLDNVPTPLFGGEGHGSDSWGWTDDNDTPDDTSDDTDYVIVTSGDGHGFLRLAEDGTAEYLGTLPRKQMQDDGGTPVLWNDVKVVNDHAYITAEDEGSQAYGVQIVDLNEVAELEPTDPTTGLVTIEEDGHLGPNLAGHNLVAFDEVDVLGVVLGEDEQCAGQLLFFDVADTPTDPQRLGCVDGKMPGIGNVPVNDNDNPALGGRIEPHDAHCIVYDGPDADYNGAGEDGELGTDDDVAASHVCALMGQESGGLILVDVSDITRDRTVDVAADGGKGGAVINRFTYDTMNYTHQGWFTDDHEFVMFNDELDESGAAALGVGGGGPENHNAQTTTYWVDVSDLDVGIKQTDPGAIYGPMPKPTAFRVNEDLVKKWSNPSTLSIDHNMYPVGNHLYQANYGAGLRVLEFTPESLRGPAEDAFTEVAYFDTYPGPGPSEFYGAWNVFPFFGQDRIILSDFQAGLLVLDVHDEVFED